MKARVVTGVGVVSALAVGRQAFFRAIQEEPGPPDDAAPIESFDGAKYPGARLAEVRGFDAAQVLGSKGLRTLDRLSKLLVVAARQCLHDAGLKRDGAWVAAESDAAAEWPARVGLVVSNAYGSLEAISELDRVALLEDRRYINPSRFPLTVSNTAAGYASIWEDLRALNVSVSDGNCGSLDAVSCADLLLEGGRADVLLVGGAEAISEPLYVAFRRLGADAASEGGAWRGGRLGEGAALLALETVENARRRGAEPLAEISGYATAFEPPRHAGALLHASPEPLARALTDALADAGLGPQDVDLVVSGRSGLRAFDAPEAEAIAQVLGPSAKVLEPKIALGETLGAGGALAMVTAVAHLGNGSSNPARKPLRNAIVTALGYYGNASALVMRAPSR